MAYFSWHCSFKGTEYTWLIFCHFHQGRQLSWHPIFLKRGLLYKEFFSYRVDSFQNWTNTAWQELSSLYVYQFPLDWWTKEGTFWLDLSRFSYLLTLTLIKPLSCWIKMPCPLLIFIQSDYLIQVVDTDSHNDKQCRSRSVGFFRSQLIWIYSICKGKA